MAQRIMFRRRDGVKFGARRVCPMCNSGSGGSSGTGDARPGGLFWDSQLAAAHLSGALVDLHTLRAAIRTGKYCYVGI